MERKSPFDVSDESYDPFDPESQPHQELQDYVKEPVDQWILEHGTTDADTYRKARSVWAELGMPVIEEDEIPPDYESVDDFDPSYIRQVTPSSAHQFCTKLKPMVFESIGLASVPMDILAQHEPDPVIVGQMFGVPREDAYVPVVVLDHVGLEGVSACISELRETFFLMNDTFTEEDHGIGVIF